MKKTFNQKVKRMYQHNMQSIHSNLLDVHPTKDGWFEYTDGRVYVKTKGDLYFDDREAEIKKCPKIGKIDAKFPDIKNIFPKTPIKAKLRVKKETLMKVLDCFADNDIIMFYIRNPKETTIFRVGSKALGVFAGLK